MHTQKVTLQTRHRRSW